MEIDVHNTKTYTWCSEQLPLQQPPSGDNPDALQWGTDRQTGPSTPRDTTQQGKGSTDNEFPENDAK